MKKIYGDVACEEKTANGNSNEIGYEKVNELANCKS